MGRSKSYPTLSPEQVELLFNRDELKDRNEKFRDIARNILCFGQTQRQTAQCYGVTSFYVNNVMQRVMTSYHRWEKENLPPGVAYLEDLLILETDRKKVEALHRRAREFLGSLSITAPEGK